MNDPNHAANQWNIYTDAFMPKLHADAGARTPRSTSSNAALGLAAANR